MHRTVIAIADATRARLFTLDRTADGGEVHDEFVEQTDLVNSARHQRPSELFSDTRPGSSRIGGLGGGLGFTFDDHRDAHVGELDLVFAREIASEVQRMVSQPAVQKLIVCASPRMLGHLRQVASTAHRDGLVVEEMARDLVKLTPPQIRDQLASYGVIPR